MESGAKRYFGRVCLKHPELRGLRRLAGRGCVDCDKVRDRALGVERRTTKGNRRALQLAARLIVDIDKRILRWHRETPEHAAVLAERRRLAKRKENKRWRNSFGGKRNKRLRRRLKREALRIQCPKLTAIERAKYQEFYDIAKARSAQTGVLWTVDHDKPLARGGLDHPGNMMLLPHNVNSLKSANFDSTLDFILS